MTYEQIEKEFDEWYPDWGTNMMLKAKTATEVMMAESEIKRRNSFKSFLKQSFIKYLQSEVERLEEEMKSVMQLFPEANIKDATPELGMQVTFKNGYNLAVDDQITHLQAQIKELEV